ncbi:MAG: hypothetical protein IKB23_07860, partial [Clostridia bacterium]|nr:hypothetical protein [Clostridia bacterium]
MKDICRLIALLLVVVMSLAACNAPVVPETTTSNEEGNISPKDEYTLPLEEGYNQLTIYFNHNETYENCDVWIWWGDKAGSGYVLHECDFGAKAVVNVPAGVESVGFIVRK